VYLGIGLITVAVAAGHAEAQVLYGGVVGTVVDANGAVVPGARVTIVNTETNLTRETTTDGQGAFSFVNVLAGPYDVKVALEGFREAVRSRVPVSVSQISRVDLRLEVGALSELRAGRAAPKTADQAPDVRRHGGRTDSPRPAVLLRIV
jgi:Carboxypeptidase regulatory-like domain